MAVDGVPVPAKPRSKPKGCTRDYCKGSGKLVGRLWIFQSEEFGERGFANEFVVGVSVIIAGFVGGSPQPNCLRKPLSPSEPHNPRTLNRNC